MVWHSLHVVTTSAKWHDEIDSFLPFDGARKGAFLRRSLNTTKSFFKVSILKAFLFGKAILVPYIKVLEKLHLPCPIAVYNGPHNTSLVYRFYLIDIAISYIKRTTSSLRLLETLYTDMHLVARINFAKWTFERWMMVKGNGENEK